MIVKETIQKYSAYYLLLLAVLLPVVAEAATIAGIIGNIHAIIKVLFPFFIGIAVVVFMWAGVQLVLDAGDEAARKSNKDKMLWGLVAIFAMLSVWGLVGIIGNSLGVAPVASPPVRPGF